MITRIPIDALQPGMILAEDVLRPDGALLVPAGAMVDSSHHRLFASWHIAQVAIDAPGGRPAGAARDQPPDPLARVRAAETLKARFVFTDRDFPPTAELYALCLPRELARREGAGEPGPAARGAARRPPAEPLAPPPTPMEIIEQDPRLVSLPDVFARINDVLNDPMSTALDAAAVIGKDTSLSTRLLTLVNSAFYGFPNKVDTLSRAVTIVGTRQLTTLALGISVLTLFRDLPPGAVDMRDFWKHSIACGLLASILPEGDAGGDMERFFVAGLLHDVGRLVLYRNLPAYASEAITLARREAILLREAERRVLGFDHALLGGMLLRKWCFPESLEKAVRHHHGPGPQLARIEPAAVHVADAVAGALCVGSSGERYAPALHPAAWTTLGLKPGALDKAVARMDADLEDIVRAFLPEE